VIGNGQTNNIIIKPEFAVYQPLSLSGDGTGGFSQAVLGTLGTPIKFYIQPPETEKYILERMNIHAIDGNWNNALQYGALGGALTNGIRIYVERDETIIREYTEFVKIKRTHDWALLAGVDSVNIGGAVADPLLVRWTFGLGCSDIELDGSKLERLVLLIQDDLTGLDDQIALVQGCRKVL